MIQPLLIGDGWVELKDGNDSCRTIFDRHYSRRVYADGRKPKLFVGPGRKLVLMLADGRALLVWREFISDDGQQGVNCAIFRNEGGEQASGLIRDAVALARAKKWPTERFYTYIDPRKVKPTMFRGYPVWGWCFYKAGWKFDKVGKGGKHVLYLPSASASSVLVEGEGEEQDFTRVDTQS
jgi:hypothetical protein